MIHRIEIEKQYDTYDLVCILADAMYACSYWCSKINYDKEEYKNAKGSLLRKGNDEENICYEDVLVEMLEMGKTIYFFDAEDGEEYKLTLEKLLYGIKLNAEQRPHDCDLDSGDAITTDCIIQYSLFEDVIYG